MPLCFYVEWDWVRAQSSEVRARNFFAQHPTQHNHASLD